MHGKPPPENVANMTFAGLLKLAMDVGLGRPDKTIDTRWSLKSLALAADGEFSPESVKKWRNSSAVPRAEYAGRLISVLTRNEPFEEQWRACLSDAYANERIREHTTRPLFLRGYRPQTIDRRIASFSISDSGQGTVGSESIAALLQLDLKPIYSDKGYAYGFRKLYIRVVVPCEVAFEIRSRLGKMEEATVGRARLRAFGNDFDPEWELESKEEILNGEYSTKDAPLFELANAKSGDEISAQLEAQLFDGSLTCSGEAAATSKEKKKIIEILMSKKIGPVEKGWIQICNQMLRVEGDDRDDKGLD